MYKEESGSSVLWFLSGAALGAVVALLYAPEAGERTRRKITRQARKSGRVVADHSRDVYEKGRDLYERGREIAEDAADIFERGRNLAEKKINETI